MNKSNNILRHMTAWMLVFALSFVTIFSNVNHVQAASNSKVKSVIIKIGSKNVTKKTYSMKKGKTVSLKVSVKPAKTIKSVSFKSKMKSVAFVNKKGKVTAKKAGTTKITVTVTGKNKKKKSTWVNIQVIEKIQDVTLTVWGPQEDQAPFNDYPEGILKAMCDQFNEEHPEWNITFNYGVCSEGDAKEVVLKDVSAAADIYMFRNYQIPELVSKGALAELSNSALKTLNAEQPEIMVKSVTYENKVYGIPFTSSTWFMYYDKSKYNENDVKSLDTMMNKNLGKGVTNFAFPLDNSWYIAAFYYGAGCTLFGDGSQPEAGCTFDNADGIAVTKYLAALAANPKFSNDNYGNSIAKFKEGKLGAYCSGSWDAMAVRDALGDNFAVTQIPTIKINGKDGQMKSFTDSNAIGVNPQCANKDIAFALASYLGGKVCQEIRFEERGVFPTNDAVAKSDAVKKDPVALAEVGELYNASVIQPLISAIDSYWTPAAIMGQEIVQGKVTEDNAEEKTHAMVKSILGK